MGSRDMQHVAAVPLSGFVDLGGAPVTGLAAIGPVWVWENPPDDLDVTAHGPVRVGGASVAILRTARTRYEQMYRQAGGVATRARVVRFLNEQAAPLLRGSFCDSVGRQLYRAAGGLVAVAGICAYDSDAQGPAQRYFHQALRLAKASGDRGFGGYVVALLVNQALFLGDFRQAVAFAEAGLRTAGPHVTPALATDLQAMQAKAYARMGMPAETRSRMADAEAAAARIRRSEEPPETDYVQPFLVEAQLAEALNSLGDYRVARQYAEEAVRSQAHARGRVHRLATLTDIDLNRGEIDSAATTAVAIITEATGMESRRLQDRIRTVRRRLAERGGRSATDVVARIDDYLSVPL